MSIGWGSWGDEPEGGLNPKQKISRIFTALGENQTSTLASTVLPYHDLFIL